MLHDEWKRLVSETVSKTKNKRSMKRNIYALLVMTFLLLGNITSFSFANCWGVLDNGVGNWTVASNCTVNGWLYSAWGNTTVGSNTVTIASDAALITNLVSNSITFTSGKILFSGNGTLYGNSADFTWYNPDTPTGTAIDSGSYTNCPSGKNARNPITNSLVTTNSPVDASRRGWVVCK